MNNPRQAANMTSLFASLDIPIGFELSRPEEGSPEAAEWSKVEAEIKQRLAYAVAVHEIGHYLDFTQREDNEISTPSLIGQLLRGGRLTSADSEMLENNFTEVFSSSSPSPSFVDAPSTSTYGLVDNQEKLAEAFLSWFTLTGSSRSSIPVDGEIVRDENGRPIPRNVRQREASTFRSALESTVAGLLEKLGPRVKNEKKPTSTARTSTTNQIPIAALLFAVLPFVDKLNSAQSTSGKMGRRRIRRIAKSKEKGKKVAQS